MVRKLVLALFAILCGGLLGGTPAIAENANFTRLCREVLVDLQKFDPVHATQMGVHEYDYLLADYSSGSVRDMIGTLRNYHKKLRRFQQADLTPHERINYRLIESNINMKLHDLDRIRWHRKSPQLYVDQAVEGLHSLMTSRHAPLSARLFQILERMKRVPKLMETAEKNIKKAPPVYIEIAQQSLADGIDFYKTVAGELMRQFPEEADEILKY